MRPDDIELGWDDLARGMTRRDWLSGVAATGLGLLTGSVGAAPPVARTGPVLRTEFGAVEIFPADNPWNQDISKLPVHKNSAAFVASIGVDRPLHPDYGTTWQGVPSGIPYVVVGPKQKRVPVRFEYAEESDPGPYPIPLDAPIEGGDASEGDRHILVIDAVNKKLYETFSTYRDGDGYRAGSGAVFDLTSNKLRPAGWTSADAAGLPVFPGLVRYDEVMEAGEIRHALRFTCRKTQRGYIAPATHWASRSKESHLPPMGLRMRLRADFPEAKFPKEALVVIRALKTYGMLLADNGGDWFVSGAPNPKWDDEAIGTLKRIKGKDFEAVETGPIVTG
jgi:hypothetical protein